MMDKIIIYAIQLAVLIPIAKLISSLLQLLYFCKFVKKSPSLLPNNFSQKVITKNNEELTVRLLSDSNKSEKL